MRRRRELSSLAIADLFAEAIAGLLQRPGRSMLTALGAVLGVGAFVSVLGITSTANGQIGGAFNQLAATEVTLTQASEGNKVTFPADVEDRSRLVNGVTAAGLRVEWEAAARAGRYPPPSPVAEQNATVVGIGTGYWDVARPDLLVGRTFSGWTAEHRTAVVGSTIAERLGVMTLDRPAYIYVNGVQFTVIGIVGESPRDPASKSSVYVPYDVAQASFGDPRGSRPPELVVATRTGAASSVAREIGTAVDPYRPALYSVETASEPQALRDKVSAELQQLFLLLAGVSLLIGAVGIANTTLVAVLERYGEIGLRRSFGALPRHIRSQFLLEATTLGALGGLVGTAIGVGATLAVAVLNDWTAVIPHWILAAAPFTGAAIGLLAGVYPAQRASRIEPIEALRR